MKALSTSPLHLRFPGQHRTLCECLIRHGVRTHVLTAFDWAGTATAPSDDLADILLPSDPHWCPACQQAKFSLAVQARRRTKPQQYVRCMLEVEHARRLIAAGQHEGATDDMIELARRLERALLASTR